MPATLRRGRGPAVRRAAALGTDILFSSVDCGGSTHLWQSRGSEPGMLSRVLSSVKALPRAFRTTYLAPPCGIMTSS